MARTTGRGAVPRQANWTRRVVIMTSIVFIVGTSLVLRHYSGAEDAQAQSPVASGAPGQVAASRQLAQRSAPPASPAAASDPNVLATVNGQHITRQELADQCLQRFGTDVLESLVNKHLIWQACEDRGIKIEKSHIDAEVNRLAGKFGLTSSRYLTMLREERGITPEQYRAEIVWPSLALRALAADQIVVTPQELQKAMEAEYGPRVKVRAITVKSRDKAEQLRAEAVKAPDSFPKLAKDHSEDQSASVQGLIPPIRRHMGDPQIEQIAFGLQPGEISPVFQVADQYVILKCEQHLDPTYIADRFRADAEARVRDRLEDQKLRSSATSVFRQLQETAQVVNVLNDASLRKQHPGVAAMINGRQITIHQLAEECVARHGHEVLDGEINRRLLLQELQRKNMQVAEQDLDAEIARVADAYGFLRPDGTPDVTKWLEEVAKEEGSLAEFYVRDVVWPTVALKKLVGQRVKVTEEDLQKGFVSNYGPRVEVLAIVLNNHRQAQQVWEQARGNPTDQFFGELAHQYSVDSISRENFGRVPPIRKYSGRPELEQEAFSLKPGELSGIIASEDNFVILRCTGYTDPVVKNLDDAVREELMKDIREKKLRSAMAVEFDRLQQSATIENYLAGTFQSPSPQGNRSAARPRAGSTATRQ